MVVVDSYRTGTQILIRVQDDFETMSMHTAALVPFRNIGQLVSRLEDIASPDMCMLLAIQICTLVLRTLDTDIFDPRALPNANESSAQDFRRSAVRVPD